MEQSYTITLYSNVAVVELPPLTGTIEEKAKKVLNMLQEICAHEHPAFIMDGWIHKCCVSGWTGLGKKWQPSVLKYMQQEKMIELVNRNGNWWIKPRAAITTGMKHAPAAATAATPEAAAGDGEGLHDIIP